LCDEEKDTFMAVSIWCVHKYSILKRDNTLFMGPGHAVGGYQSIAVVHPTMPSPDSMLEIPSVRVCYVFSASTRRKCEAGYVAGSADGQEAETNTWAEVTR